MPEFYAFDLLAAGRALAAEASLMTIERPVCRAQMAASASRRSVAAAFAGRARVGVFSRTIILGLLRGSAVTRLDRAPARE
jgi:hypothetical protein